jgi:hypothetical protein
LVSSASNVAALHSASSAPSYMSIVALPDHVLESRSGAGTNYMLTVTAMVNRSNARFCMIHKKDLQIQIWMHNLDGGTRWMLVETICFTGCTFSVNDT